MAEAAPDLERLFSVRDKRVLVTGGSQGIGRMIAAGFVAAGAVVYITARDAERCDAAAAEMAAGRGSCTSLPHDLAGEEGREALVAELDEREERLDVLVNNAATIWGAGLDEYPLSAWEKVLNVNVVALFELTRMLLARLRAGAASSPPARIVNIGSADGIRPPAWETYAYTASKAAVHMITRHLAARLAGEAITVNAIAPGPFATKKLRFATDGHASDLAATVPLGRLGDGADAAGAALFLASRAGAYVTGTVLPLDGGMSNRDPDALSPAELTET